MNLYKNSHNKLILGVCSGLAESIGIPIVWMRVIWACMAFFTLLIPVITVYLILFFILPDKDSSSQRSSRNVMLAAAALMIGVGVFIILNALISIDLNQYILPALLVGAGGYILFRSMKKRHN